MTGREIAPWKLKKALEQLQDEIYGWGIACMEERVKRGYRIEHAEPNVFSLDHLNSSYDYVTEPHPKWYRAEELGKEIAKEEKSTKLSRYLSGK